MANEILRVTSGKAAGETIELDGELVFGREAGGSGTLGDDTELSRRHAQIRRGSDGGLVIEDLGSSNGTLVNGKPIDGPTPLRPGDKIKMGGTTLELPAGAGDATTVSQRPDLGATKQVAQPQVTSVSQRPPAPPQAPPAAQAPPPAPPKQPPARKPAPPSPPGPPGFAGPGAGRPSGPPKPLIALIALILLGVGIGVGALIWKSDDEESAPAVPASQPTPAASTDDGYTEFSLLGQGFSDETLDEASMQREVRITMKTFKAPFGIETLHLHKYLDESTPPPQKTYDGIYTFTTKDGDSLSMRAQGIVTEPEGPDKIFAQTHEDLAFVSGTGPFADASGTGTVTTAVLVGVRGPRAAPTGSQVVKYIDFKLKLEGDSGEPIPAPPLATEAVGTYRQDNPDEISAIDEAQRATGRYLNPDNAERDGYVPALQNGKEVCSSLGGKGNGAIEYVNQSLVNDGTVEVGKPEVLLYMPSEPGRTLIGVEYRAGSGDGGKVFGQQVKGDKPLVAWIWLFNPAGLLSPTNERSPCAPGPAKEFVPVPGLVAPPGPPPGAGGGGPPGGGPPPGAQGGGPPPGVQGGGRPPGA